MATETEIREHYKKEFNDNQPDEKELAIILEQKCDCHQCGKSIFEMYDYPDFTEDDRMLCEDCYRDEYYDNCNVCGDTYEKHETVEEHIFYINVETAKELRMKTGIYQVLQLPYFYGNIVTGFESFFDNAIQLSKEINIDEIQKFHRHEEPKSGLICYGCFVQYTGKQRYFTNYLDKPTRIHRNINMRGFIEKGKVF